MVDWWQNHQFPGLLSEYVREGSLVFDIGANIGKMVYAYLALGARVVAVEPQQVCVEKHLRPRFGDDDRVTIVHAACGASEGHDVITTYGQGSTISTMVPDHYWGSGGPWAGTPRDGTEIVETVTLDMLIEEHGVPDFIKVDVEGYEIFVLEGLSAFCPLSFEFHPYFAANAKECLKRVLAIEPGAEFNYTQGEALIYASEWMDWIRMGEEMDRLMAQYGKDYFGNIYTRKATDAR